MAEIVPITDEEKEKITPHLKEHLDPDSWHMIDDIFNYGVVHTYPDRQHFITVHFRGGFACPQFDAATGEFAEITRWDYILTVDTAAQIAENEELDRIELLSAVLKYYHTTKFNYCTDYEKVIAAREPVTIDGVECYKYKCPGQDIYLNQDNYPVTYDKQLIKDGYYYYTFRNQDADPDDISVYDYKIPYEWKRYEVGE